MTAHHHYRYWAYSGLRVTLALAITGFLWGRGQEEAKHVLNISIVDEASGLPVPARLEVLDEQGKGYIAEDALLVGSRHPGLFTQSSRGSEDKGLFKQQEGWNIEFIGTLEEWKQGLHRRAGPIGEYAKQFYSPGTSTLSVRPGTYWIRVFKGFEYFVARQEVTVRAGETTETRIQLKRWTKMSDSGWYSADDHIHIGRQFKELDGAISHWMQAEDLHVANMLQGGNYRRSGGTPQHTFGQEGVFRDADYIIAPGQEYPRSHFLGHWIILGSNAFIPGRGNYLMLGDFFEEAKRRGGLSGAAHFGASRGAANGISMVLNQDHLDFIEILQVHGGFYNVWYQIWYDILNTGFRITPIAGSDYSWGQREKNYPGRERFYTHVEGRFTFDAWMESLRQGRTFVTNGPMVTFSVAGREIGDEVRLEKPGMVVIRGSVQFDPERDVVQKLEVVQNGEVIRTVKIELGKSKTQFELEHEVSESAWLALRVSGEKPGTKNELLYGRSKLTKPLKPIPSLAHSAAIYVVLENAPSLAEHPRAKKLVRSWIDRLNKLERSLAPDQIKQLVLVGPPGDGISEELLWKNREALLETIQSARERFWQRLDGGLRQSGTLPEAETPRPKVRGSSY